MTFIKPPSKVYDATNDAVFRRSLEREIAGLKRATEQGESIPDAILGTEVTTINLILAYLRDRGMVAR